MAEFVKQMTHVSNPYNNSKFIFLNVLSENLVIDDNLVIPFCFYIYTPTSHFITEQFGFDKQDNALSIRLSASISDYFYLS
jgi:hypothetical protein